MGNFIRTAAVAMAVLALAACGEAEEPAAKPALTVSVAAVGAQDLPRRIEASGAISAWEDVPVAAETGGLTAVAVNAEEGDYVRQGQVLVKMNDELLVSQLRQQEAQVASAKAQLAQANNSLSRARELLAKGFLAQAALDARLAEQEMAAAQTQAAEAALVQTRARLAQTAVRAPVAGRIVSRSVVKGQIVQPGVELFRLVREGRLELDAEIPETELARVRPGMSATVQADEVGQSPGVVRIVTPEVDPRTRLGVARIALSAPAGFRPGMFARAVIDAGSEAALTVPQAAIVFRDNKAGVFVIDNTNHARFTAVRTGVRTGERVEILAGLAAGARVAVKGAGFLADGDLVRVAG